MSHTHAVVKKLTLTFMSKQTPLKNYTSIQKLYWKAASSRGICSGSRFATIRSAAEWQKKTHKIVFILRINLEICSLEMGKRDGSMMLQEMKTKRNNYQLFQLLLVADSSEGKKTRDPESNLFSFYSFLNAQQRNKQVKHTHTRRTKTNTVARRGIDYYY